MIGAVMPGFMPGIHVSTFVTTGLDPVVHADLPAAWIAGSSPAMTRRNDRRRHARLYAGHPRLYIAKQDGIEAGTSSATSTRFGVHRISSCPRSSRASTS